VLGFRCEVKAIDDMHQLSPADLLSSYQAICLLSVAEPNTGLNAQLWGKLRDYVQKGGGLAIIPGSKLRPDAYNAETASQLLPAEFVGIVTAKDKPGVAWNEGGSNHPLLVPFRDWRKKADVDFHREEFRPRAERYWAIKPYPGDSEVVVRYTDEQGLPALAERKVGQGRVLVFTVPFDTEHKDWHDYWTGSSFGLVLADKAMGYLAGDAEKATFNFRSGQLVTVALPPAPSFPIYALEGPGLSGTETSVRRPEGPNTVSISQAVQPGLYKLTDPKNQTVAGFSINVRPEESQLVPRVPPEQIEALLGPGSVVTVEQGGNLRDALQGRWLQPLELFPWLMLALLLTLAVEGLLANKFYRQAKAPQEEPSVP
jgi:hypothetical protein